MIRHSDLSARTSRIAQRIREIGALLPTERERPRQGVDPLGLGLTYPVMFMAYDIERDIETPLSGLIHEDDPNLVVVSLVAEAIADEDRIGGFWQCERCESVAHDLDDPFGPGPTPCYPLGRIVVECVPCSPACPRTCQCACHSRHHEWTRSPSAEIVYVMEVWHS